MCTYVQHKIPLKIGKNLLTFTYNFPMNNNKIYPLTKIIKQNINNTDIPKPNPTNHQTFLKREVFPTKTIGNKIITDEYLKSAVWLLTSETVAPHNSDIFSKIPGKHRFAPENSNVSNTGCENTPLLHQLYEVSRQVL